MTVEEITAPPAWEGSEGLLALLVRDSAGAPPGVTFFTPRTAVLQAGVLRHPAGHRVAAHTHRAHSRFARETAEVLVVRSGRLRATFFTTAGEPVCVRDVGPGDVLVLLAGGHGFEVLEDCDVVEAKTGPYAGEAGDKVRF